MGPTMMIFVNVEVDTLVIPTVWLTVVQILMNVCSLMHVVIPTLNVLTLMEATNVTAKMGMKMTGKNSNVLTSTSVKILKHVVKMLNVQTQKEVTCAHANLGIKEQTVLQM